MNLAVAIATHFPIMSLPSTCSRCGTTHPIDAKCPQSQVLWQMDVRHRLGLRPDANDRFSQLLFTALYASRSEAEFVESLQAHVDELQKVIVVLKGGMR